MTARAVAVLGAGSWGTALAVHLGRLGHDVRLWARDEALAREMTGRRANAVYLPDVRFPPRMRVTHDIAEALDQAEVVVMAAPSHGTRDIARLAAPFVPRGAIVVSATKGLEQHTLYRVSEILEQELGPDVAVAVMSGPSFASELALLNCGTTIAAKMPNTITTMSTSTSVKPL